MFWKYVIAAVKWTRTVVAPYVHGYKSFCSDSVIQMGYHMMIIINGNYTSNNK